MKFKRLKLHGVEEPLTDWSKLTDESDREWAWLKNMYWYRLYSNTKQQKSWVDNYLKNEGLDPKEYGHGKKRMYEGAGALCRVLETGCPEDHKLMNLLRMLLNQIKEESSRYSSTSKENAKKSTKVVPIKDRMHDQLSEYMDAINRAIDIFTSNPKIRKKEWFSIGKWLSDNKVKSTQTMAILKEIKPIYNEVSAAYNNEDEQLAEAYDFMRKSHLHKFVEFLDVMVKEINQHLKKVKPKRPSRKTNPESVVKRLPFKKSSDELGVDSIEPTDILGCTTLFVYNETSRLICVYRSFENNGGLSVKGASITHFDPARSFVKKCRNPKHTIRLIGRLNKKHAIEHVDGIKTVKKPVRPRINKNCIILRAF
tara:strand:+ start:5835 stop:6938 length:1104 start_codon:yes stop_codon:yes gene_type:complete